MNNKRIILTAFLGLLATTITSAQAGLYADGGREETFYIALNPVAPFTSLRNETAARRLPIASNLETGLAVSGGKWWNRRYNLETRFSYGSPMKSYRLMLVQSSFHYCFAAGSRRLRPYAGLFVKLYSLTSNSSNTEQSSVMGGLSAGGRWMARRFFVDARLSEHIAGLSWSSLPQSKARAGFPPSIYQWESPYVPYLAIGIGYVFK